MLIVRERNSEKTGRIFASKDTIDERGATVNVELTSDHYRRPPLVHSRLEIKCNVTGTVSLATPRLVPGINYNNSQNIWTYSNFHVKWNTCFSGEFCSYWGNFYFCFGGGQDWAVGNNSMAF